MSDIERSKRYFSAAVSIVLPLLIIVGIAVVLLTTFVFKLDCSIQFTMYFIVLAIYNMLMEYVRGLRNLKVYSIANMASGCFILVLSCVLVGWLRLGIGGVLAVYPIAYGMVAAAILIRYRPVRLAQFDKSLAREMLCFSLPLIPNNIAWWITNVSNRTIINIMIGSFYNGLYAVSSKIPTFLSLAFGVFNMAFQQTAILSINEEDGREYFNTLLRNLIGFLGSACIAIISVVPFLYEWFIDSSYWSGINCVPLLLAGTFLLSLAQFLGDILLAKRETRLIGTSTIVAAVLNVLLNIFLIGSIGLMSAAMASFVGYVAMFLLRMKELKDVFDFWIITAITAKWLLLQFVFAWLFVVVLQINGWYFLALLLTWMFLLYMNRGLVLTLLDRARRKRE